MFVDTILVVYIKNKNTFNGVHTSYNNNLIKITPSICISYLGIFLFSLHFICVKYSCFTKMCLVCGNIHKITKYVFLAKTIKKYVKKNYTFIFRLMT